MFTYAVQRPATPEPILLAAPKKVPRPIFIEQLNDSYIPQIRTEIENVGNAPLDFIPTMGVRIVARIRHPLRFEVFRQIEELPR